MSDLISRSELYNLPIYKFGVSMLSAEEYIKVSDIEKIPTAYDVDTVVAELDKNAKRHGGEDYFVEFGDAVEIVKQGGITYDCNNCANYTEPDEIDNGCYLCCKGYENNYKPKADNGGASDAVCEWKPDKAFDGMYKACSGDVTYIKGFKYCPYCSKKIKVVE